MMIKSSILFLLIGSLLVSTYKQEQKHSILYNYYYGSERMIFKNENGVELDLDIVQRIVARIFVHQDGNCHQMQSWESPAWNVTGYFISDAIKTLQNEGFERVIDQDPY